jgi:hypothetical protein
MAEFGISAMFFSGLWVCSVLSESGIFSLLRCQKQLVSETLSIAGAAENVNIAVTGFALWFQATGSLIKMNYVEQLV